MANLFRMRVNIDYLRFLVKRNRRFIILMTSAMLVVFPILYLTTMTISPNSRAETIRVLGQVLNLILLIISAFILPIILFSYMNKKKDLDVYHALPITQGDLFITTAVSSLILLTLPFIISWLSGNLVSLDAEFTWVNMLENGLSSLLIAYAIAAIVTLALVHVGTSADGIIYAALLNVLPVSAYLAYNFFRSIIFLGFSMENSVLRIVGLIFPIWSIFENQFEFSDRMFDSSLFNGLYWLAWTIIIFSLSRLVYINRKHEKAESAFTNQYFFPVISSFFMIILIFIMYSSFYTISENTQQSFYTLANFIFPFFFAGVVYLVMDTISQRSFKHLFKAMLKYLIISIAGFSLLLLGLFSRNFSFVTRIPDLEDVKSIELTLNDYQHYIFNSDYTYNNYNDDFNTITINDEAGIQAIIHLHNIILDEYAWIDYSTSSEYRYNSNQLITAIEASDGYTQSYESYPFTIDNAYSQVYVSFTYELNGGQKISRQYQIPYTWTKVLYELYDSPSILKYIAPGLAYIDTYSTVGHAILREYTNADLVEINNIDLNQLKEAYLKDMDSWTKDTYLELQDQTLAVLNLRTEKQNNYIETDITLSNLTVNTNAYLASLVDFPQPADDFISITLVDTYNHEENMLFHRPSTASYYYFENPNEKVMRYVQLNAELYQAILPYTTQFGLSEEPLLAISIREANIDDIELDNMNFNNTMLIKNEYRDIVLDLIKDLEVKESTDFYVFDTMLSQ